MTTFKEDLAFEPCPVRAPAERNATVKVAVLRSGAIKVMLGAGAYARLLKPVALAVETAGNDDAGYLRLTPAAAGAGWPARERDTPGRRGGQPFASVTIAVHPFTPGVVHRAQEVEADWGPAGPASSVVIALPDWAAMRAQLADGDDAA